ncbi:MAG: amidase domain-containing protein, partial [Actinobacteria bacterium]|nr:amidase domain-containing protein [Actinomycetota bacterium]
MFTKRLLIGTMSTSLAALTLITQSANATEPLTESQAITKVQYLVDSLNSEIVNTSSQSDAWTSDFPLMQTQLDALSLQLNAFGNRFANLGSQFLSVESTLSNCALSSGSSSLSLICDKFTALSLYAGEGEELSGNEMTVRVRYIFNLNGDLTTWNLVSGYSDDSYPMDEMNFNNASLDQPVTYSRNTRMLPPLDYSGLSDARKQMAAEYAKEYSIYYNTAYIEYPKDCANFVSQAMKAAGWKAIGNGSLLDRDELVFWGYWNNYSWPNNNTTKTWYNADYLYSFVTTPNSAYTTRGYKLGTFTNDEIIANKGLLEVGDLVFYNWEGPSVP